MWSWCISRFMERYPRWRSDTWTQAQGSCDQSAYIDQYELWGDTVFLHLVLWCHNRTVTSRWSVELIVVAVALWVKTNLRQSFSVSSVHRCSRQADRRWHRCSPLTPEDRPLLAPCMQAAVMIDTWERENVLCRCKYRDSCWSQRI